jgi:hypothetical protein
MPKWKKKERMYEEIERKKEATETRNEISPISGKKMNKSLNLIIYVLVVED